MDSLQYPGKADEESANVVYLASSVSSRTDN